VRICLARCAQLPTKLALWARCIGRSRVTHEETAVLHVSLSVCVCVRARASIPYSYHEGLFIGDVLPVRGSHATRPSCLYTPPRSGPRATSDPPGPARESIRLVYFLTRPDHETLDTCWSLELNNGS
jgi:hypothetical protein